MPDVERTATTHPSQAALAAFAAGYKTGEEADALAAHLEQCEACFQAAYGDGPEDNLTLRLRAVTPPRLKRTDTTYSEPGPEASGTAQSTKDTSYVPSLEKSGIITAQTPPAIRRAYQMLESKGALPAHLQSEAGLTAFQAEEIKAGRLANLILGNYLLLERIAVGGMGTVFKARHLTMDRIVALKVISARLVESELAIARFEKEVKAAARLTHANIVTAHDAGEDRGTCFLVMEYVQGVNLSEVVAQEGPLSVERARSYIVQAARGLAYAHEHKVIHRDIKPSNLMLDQDGTVKLLDLGLARIVEEIDPRQNSSSAHTLMGTVDYLAPEQAADARQADARSDIYSLGCTLWFLLTAKPLLAADSAYQSIVAHRERQPESLASARPDAAALDPILRKMVAKKPAERYQSMGELIAALQEVPSPVQVAAAASSPWRWRIALAGLVVLAVVLLAPFVLKLLTPAGTIVIACDQDIAGAEISVDGEKKIIIHAPGETEPIKVEADGKEHTLIVSKGGFRTLTRKFTVTAGKNKTITVHLEPNPFSDRDVAKLVQQAGGSVHLRIDDETIVVAPKQSLPEKTGTLVGIQFEHVPQVIDLEPFLAARDMELLYLRDSAVTRRSLEVLHQWPRLNNIGMTGKSYGDDSMTPLSRVGGLTRLDISNTSVGDKGIKELRKCEKIKWLSLSATELKDQGLETIASLPNLEELDLSNSAVAGVGLRHLRSAPRLKGLGLHDSQLTAADLVEIANLKHLRDLGLNGSKGVNDKSCAELLKAPWVERLSLDDTSVTNEGLAILAAHPSLRHLGIGDLPITDAGVAHSSRIRTLSSLALHGTKITNQGLKSLEGLSLTYLVLSNTGISDEGVPSIGTLTTLSELSLENTKVSDASIPFLAKLQKLSRCHLNGTRVTAEGVKKLRAALPKCEVHWTWGNVSDEATDRDVVKRVQAAGGRALWQTEDQIVGVGSKQAPPEQPGKLIGIEFEGSTWLIDLEPFLAARGVKHLVLRDTKVTQQSLRMFAQWPLLDYVVLREKSYGDDTLVHLSKILRLTHLDIAGTSIGDKGLQELRNNQQLTYLNVASTDLTDRGVEVIATLPNLNWLVLSDTAVSGAGLSQLQALPRLNFLELHRSRLTATDLVEVAKMRQLRDLLLDDSKSVDDKACAELLKAPWIERLNLDSTAVTDEGLAILSAHPSLRHLGVGGTSIGNVGVAHLSKIKTLSSLRLNSTKITNDGLKSLNGLPLTHLNLADTDTTDEGVRSIERMATLLDLELANTKVTDVSIPILAKLPNLVRCDLRDTSVTAEGAAKLRAALPKCQVLWEEKLPSKQAQAPSTGEPAALVKGGAARIDLRGVDGTNKVFSDDGGQVLIPSDFLGHGTAVLVLDIEPERVRIRWVDKQSTVEGWVDRKIVVPDQTRQP